MPPAMTEQHLQEETFACALRKLTLPLPSQRRQARAELVTMGPDAMLRLLREHKRLTTLLSRHSPVFILLYLFTNALGLIRDHMPGRPLWLSALHNMVMVCGLVFALYDCWLGWRLFHIRHAVAAFDDPRAIGSVAEVLKKKRYRRSVFWRARLLHLLSQVETAAPETLQQVDCASLNKILAQEVDYAIPLARRDTELVTAILKAYPYIGDAAALGKVKYLALRRNDPLRSVAQDCLPKLRERVVAAKERRKLEQVGADLLRASSNEAVTPEVLLRAASGSEANAATQSPQQLLRPLEREV